MNKIFNRLSLLVGVVIGLSVLYYFSSRIESTTKFEDIALGAGTTTNLAQVNNVRIHCHDLNDDELCLTGYTKLSNENPVVLWLGNSQVHAINQMKEGNETAVPNLYRKLKVENQFLMTFSQPNANLQEHYLLFNYLLMKLPIRTLIVPVVFDDMRETGVRDSLVDVLKEEDVSLLVSKTEIGRKLLADNGDLDAAGNDMSALNDTVQESTENWLNEKMNNYQVWSNRPELRGQLFLALYKFRNWILQIKPTSVRRMLPGNYSLNRQALEAMLIQAVDRGIKVLVYVVPLRNDVSIPYIKEEYTNFKTDMKNLSVDQSAHFITFENLVPAEYWGTKSSTSGDGQEIDFMHFTSDGHQLLSNALYLELQAMSKNGGEQ